MRAMSSWLFPILTYLVTQNPRWETIVPQSGSPPARSGHTASVYDFKIYVFGGADADYFYNDIWCFDTRALTWTPIPASGYLPTGRYGHSCALVDGVLYIFGGNSPDGTELNDAYAFKINGKHSLDSLQTTIGRLGNGNGS